MSIASILCSRYCSRVQCSIYFGTETNRKSKCMFLNLFMLICFTQTENNLEDTKGNCFFLNVYFWEVGKEQRERETEDFRQALCWQLRVWFRAQTHELWDHDLSWSETLNWLSQPGPQEKLPLRNTDSVIIVRDSKWNCILIFFTFFNFQF